MSLRELRDLVLRHAPAQGSVDLPIGGLQLFRVTEPMPTAPSIYPASFCVLVAGTKRVYLGGEAKTYDERSFVCCTMPLPVEAEIPHASPSNPVVGLLLSLETPAMTETLVAAEASARLEPDEAGAEATPGLVVAPLDDAFVDALSRLLQLLDDPSARQVLAASRLRELYFALLRSGAGGAIRRTFGASRDLGRALAFLHEHLAEPVSVQELARIAGMSKAVFHRRFKAVTTLSPLQFVKAIRLNNAAAMIAGGVNIADAAGQVGYASPSQFSREFSRQYGMPPRRWATHAVPAAPAGR
ncbi:MAG: AraC family transcriptional regulator [Deltaproteobacteria bacterium]|nr:MAG: AraC family transcriptional regulator [Deltaproteobacteria bacterium]